MQPGELHALVKEVYPKQVACEAFKVRLAPTPRPDLSRRLPPVRQGYRTSICMDTGTRLFAAPSSIQKTQRIASNRERKCSSRGWAVLCRYIQRRETLIFPYCTREEGQLFYEVRRELRCRGESVSSIANQRDFEPGT